MNASEASSGRESVHKIILFFLTSPASAWHSRPSDCSECLSLALDCQRGARAAILSLTSTRWCTS